MTLPSPHFTVHNDNRHVLPVVISVAHAGRHYGDIAPLLRVPLSATRSLEDRFSDRLIARAISHGVTAIVATTARLVIDLNRNPADLDPATVRGGFATADWSARARAGLGLIPTRLPAAGKLWRAPFDPGDVEHRLARIHAPYHAALSELLHRTRAHWGGVVLIDVHSMPSLPSGGPDIVIGDCFGGSAASPLARTAAATLLAHGFRVGANVPYAGGYIAKHHGRPDRNIHALQIEIDRRLYLDQVHDRTSTGLPRMQDAVAILASALSEALPLPLAAAAE